jgi:hypothetical protein
VQGSAIGTSLPRRCAAVCLELAKADVHLIGIRPGSLTEQIEPEGLSGLEVDHQLKLGWQLD